MVKNILTTTDLTAYFYVELERINNKQVVPLHTNVILYCSDLLSEFALINKLYDEKEDKYHERIMGLSLLTVNNFDEKNKFKKLKEIADTSLMLCGYFVESLDKKILGINYYKKIGMFSYLELDKISPEYRDQPSFFRNMANTYEFIIKTFQILKATQSHQNNPEILKILPSINNSQS
jgi:hypothetical protein